MSQNFLAGENCESKLPFLFSKREIRLSGLKIAFIKEKKQNRGGDNAAEVFNERSDSNVRL